MAKNELSSIKELLQKHLIDEMDEIVTNHPFHAFCLMGIAIEVFGKLIKPGREITDVGTSEEDFKYAIDNLEAFEDYRELPFDLFSSLRCSLVHQMLPGKDIILSPSIDAPKQRKLGTPQMYARVKDAWAEVLESEEAKKKIYKKGGVIKDGDTGGTKSNIAIQIIKGK